MQRNNREQKIDLIEELLKNPQSFSFIQVLRILSKKVGRENFFEKVDIRPDLSMAFPSTDIVSIEKKGSKYIITVSFLGLYGVSSPLPAFYTEELIQEYNNDKSVKRDFIDVLNKRVYEFYFELWLRTHPGILYREFKNENAKKIFFKIYYPLSAFRIKNILKDMGFESEIKEFADNVTEIEKEDLTKLSRQKNILGVDSHIGRYAKNRNKFIIKIKVSKRKFTRFIENMREINDFIFKKISSPVKWDWEISFSKAQRFSLNEMKLGINSVIGKTDTIKLKGKK